MPRSSSLLACLTTAAGTAMVALAAVFTDLRVARMHFSTSFLIFKLQPASFIS